MFRRLAYTCLLLCGCCLYGCGPLFKMQLPPGLTDTFRSGKMHSGLFGKTGTTVLEYQAKKDSVVFSDYTDTTITFGIIFPRSKMVATSSTRERAYNSDSIQCYLHYDTKDIYSSSESQSVVTNILLPPKKDVAGFDEGHINITSYYKYFKGFIYSGNDNDTACFSFEQIRAHKQLDTAVITGYVTYRSDSFVLRPFYYAVPQNKKKQQFIFMLEGYGLYKQQQLYAFLQYAPLIEPGHEKLQLNKQASGKEQLLLAAYLTLLYDRL